MSTEPEPTQPTEPEPQPADEPEPPVEVDEPTQEPEPEPEDSTPPPPDAPAEPITFEPATWYEVESACKTPTCVNFNTTTTEPEVYSNAGTIRMICARCGKDRQILSATKLDPQPEMS